jgi:Zn-dependent peptidase ImmA (M78 family)/DNA-binding XRE family transcriptional regulator
MIANQSDLGKRIAYGRDEAGMTQAELAAVVGVDRTAVAKIEAGARKVSATELVAIATALDRPVDWFVFESPPAVISRRSDPTAGGQSQTLDLRVDRLGRDIAFLLNESVLAQGTRAEFDVPADFAAAEQLAADARALMDVSDGPLYDLQRACEQAGLLAFSLELGESGGDAAYVEVDSLGVALVNGTVDPGRRRFNLAHELGHHLVGDAYAAETTVMVGDDAERLINTFAAYLLMPRAGVTELWSQAPQLDRRLAAIAVSVRFRTSWTATCSHLHNLDLIDAAERDDFCNAPPKKGDFFELGERWVAELDAPSVPPDYGRRVVSAYRAGKLAAARTVELLWGTVTESELPELEDIPLDGLRREFDALR